MCPLSCLEGLKPPIGWVDLVKYNFRFDEIQELEYRPVRVRGTFLHDKEIYMGPRGLMHEGAGGDSFLGQSVQGYHVITPFKLADRE